MERNLFQFSCGFGVVPGGKSVDRAEFVAGGAVFFLFGDGGEVGQVVDGGHGDGAHPETGEGGVAVEEGAVFGVRVEEVKRCRMCGLRGFYVAEEAAENGQFKGMEEEGEGGVGGEGMSGGVGVVEVEGRERIGL